MVPTQAARIIYRHGEAILKQREVALQELMAYLNRLEGSLTVAASTIPGEYLLPQVLVAFNAQFPRVEVKLTISDSQEVCDQVAKGRAELGCSGAQLERLGLEYHHFASDKLALVVPNSSRWRKVERISMEDLRHEPFLAREAGSGTRLSFEEQLGHSLDRFNVQGRPQFHECGKRGSEGWARDLRALASGRSDRARQWRAENSETRKLPTA